jgi:riboflavin synthase alpha subunit
MQVAMAGVCIAVQTIPDADFRQQVVRECMETFTYPQRLEFQAAATLKQTPRGGVIAHDEHASWI